MYFLMWQNLYSGFIEHKWRRSGVLHCSCQILLVVLSKYLLRFIVVLVKLLFNLAKSVFGFYWVRIGQGGVGGDTFNDAITSTTLRIVQFSLFSIETQCQRLSFRLLVRKKYEIKIPLSAKVILEIITVLPQNITRGTESPGLLKDNSKIA